jgi:hypothetical protein
MGWKTRFGAVVGAMIAISTGVFPTEIGALINSIVPNAGFYIVRISFSAAALYLGALLIDGVYRRWFKKFEAEVVGKEPFLLGGVVGFKASFRGKLEKGFFTCKVLPPKGTLLPTKEKTHEWWPCYGTFQRMGTRDVGILRGSRNYEFPWEAKMPEGYPEGEYTVFVGVYESSALSNDVVKEKRLSFLVLDPKNVFSGSPGASGMLHWRRMNEGRSGVDLFLLSV